MIHPTAIVDKQAKIAKDVEIGPFCVIEGPVEIGEATRLYQSVYISGKTKIGKGCIIHPFSIIGHYPQDFSFDKKNETFTFIGDNCEFREGVTVHRGTKPGTSTIIGNNVYLMANCHIGHNCNIGDNVTMSNASLMGGYVEVGNNAYVSGLVAAHQFVRIGQYAMVGTSCFLNMDVPPFCMAHKVPGVIIGMNTVGMKRAGFDQVKRSEIKSIFKIIYLSKLNKEEILIKIKDLKSKYSKLFITFIEKSKRGITKYDFKRSKGKSD